MSEIEADSTARVERRLRVLKLILGIVAATLTVLKLLGSL